MSSRAQQKEFKSAGESGIHGKVVVVTTTTDTGRNDYDAETKRGQVKREPMTPAGLERLMKELEHIKHIERPANIKAIEEARSHGDLSENADYDAAKNEQGLIQGRMKSLEDLQARAEVIDPKTLSGSNIMFGATVTLSDTDTGDEVKYKILGSYEVDIKKNIISVESPIGKALIGKEVGDEVTVQVPGGARRFVIEEVLYR